MLQKSLEKVKSRNCFRMIVMITYREFTSFINDELVRVGTLFTENSSSILLVLIRCRISAPVLFWSIMMILMT